MKSVFEVQGNCLTVHLPEEVDHPVSEDIRKESDNIMRKKFIRTMIFDFSETMFMDSSGSALILRSQQRMQLMEGSVVLRNVPEQARRVQDAAGIGRQVSNQ